MKASEITRLESWNTGFYADLYEAFEEAISELRFYSWRKMESIPRDGTEVLVGYGHQPTGGNPGFPVSVVYFRNNTWYSYGNPQLGLEANATCWKYIEPNPGMEELL